MNASFRRFSRNSTVLAMLSATLLAGCGFQLRGAQPLPFQSIYLTMNPYSELAQALKRQLKANDPTTRIVESANEAQVQLQVALDTTEKEILGLDARGQVREYQLQHRFGFRLIDAKGKTLIPYNEIYVYRDISFNDAQVLAKDQEEKLLYRDMNEDIVQQLLRRLAATPSP